MRVAVFLLVLSQLLTARDCAAEKAADPYDALYDLIMTRYGPDGKSYAENESSPAIFLLSDFPFGDKTYMKLNAALDAFAALPQAKIEAYSNVKRALLQRHLWEVFDATFPLPERWSKFAESEGQTKDDRELRSNVRKRLLTQDRRAAFQPKIASLIRRLALTRERVLGLSSD